MIIDFTDEELDLICDALEEMRISTDNDKTIFLIEDIADKMWKASKNDNS